MRKGSSTSSMVSASSPMACARLSRPTGPPENFSITASSSLRSMRSSPSTSPSSILSAASRGSAGARGPRQLEAARARRQATADDDVALETLERAVEWLLHYRRQSVDLVEEQHAPRFQIRHDGGEIPRALEHRPRRLAQ